MDDKEFSKILVIWYGQHKRALPWRYTLDPYKIWLSEIILQQTRVEQGLPYYQKFIKTFKNLQSLAKAETQQVLRLWQGLGYYSRARNLHRCAQTIVEDYNGEFPSDYKELLKLPGIGKYTAAAIASFAFKEKVPVVDGNVIRVISRIYGIEEEVAAQTTIRNIYEIANSLIPDENPDIFNQAIMEFGAIQCVPNKPSCESCIFNHACFAYLQNKVNSIPLKAKRAAKRKRYFHYLVVAHGGSYLLNKRKGKDIWHGLYEFPLVESEELLEPDRLDIQWPGWPKTMALTAQSLVYKHILTHQEIYAVFYSFAWDGEKPGFEDLKSGFYSLDEIEQLPKPILIERFLKEKIN